MKTAYIIQPGKLGDLIINIPIASYYSKLGYRIKWYVFDNFCSFFKSYPYIEAISVSTKIDNKKYFSSLRTNFSDVNEQRTSYNYFYRTYEDINRNYKEGDIILDICWGFPFSSIKNNTLISVFNEKNRNWIDMRYHIANVPLKERWNFSWERNEKKEDELLKIILEFSENKFGSKKYSIYHNYSNNSTNAQLKNQINFAPINEYEIYDWYKVLLNAEEIACVDSSLCNFVEVLPELKNKKKYYLGTEEPHYINFMRNILLNNWVSINNNKIISDYLHELL